MMVKKAKAKPPQAGKKTTEVDAMMLIGEELGRIADALETMASPPQAEPKEEPEPASPEPASPEPASE